MYFIDAVDIVNQTVRWRREEKQLVVCLATDTAKFKMTSEEQHLAYRLATVRQKIRWRLKNRISSSVWPLLKKL